MSQETITKINLNHKIFMNLQTKKENAHLPENT